MGRRKKLKTQKCAYCSAEVGINHKGNLTRHLRGAVPCVGTGFCGIRMGKLVESHAVRAFALANLPKKLRKRGEFPARKENAMRINHSEFLQKKVEIFNAFQKAFQKAIEKMGSDHVCQRTVQVN